jgi:hypothetical protein
MSRRPRRHDSAHHHPVVHQNDRGVWGWQCRCGGASCRTTPDPISWHHAVVQALAHASALAA